MPTEAAEKKLSYQLKGPTTKSGECCSSVILFCWRLPTICGAISLYAMETRGLAGSYYCRDTFISSSDLFNWHLIQFKVRKLLKHNPKP